MAVIGPPERLTTDVLVIGGGLAALRAAIAAREAGANVVVCCKGTAGRSGNTIVSTADISAYVLGLGPDDSEDTFRGDTLGSGGHIGDPRLVQVLVEQSGAALLDLERLGVRLLRDGERIDRTRAAGHSRARTYRAESHGYGLNKGMALSLPLAERARALGARILDRCPVVGLCTDGAAVSGVIAVDLASGAVLAIGAGAIVLAAGGASNLFARSNGTGEATGDAIALAVRAGAVARDMEFVQWHPTRMDQPVPLFLSNGLLADGAVFRDRAGREFMSDYDSRGNLAPRDVLAKAVYVEIQADRGVDGGVYLDCSGILPERVDLRHAYLRDTLQKHGVDFPGDWLVASPATHFLMGGIEIDAGAASSASGLFVAGESAGGIHGANRLGGNAFCEGLVFGTIAGKAAAAHARKCVAPEPPVEPLEEIASCLGDGRPDVRAEVKRLWGGLKETMWREASIVRSGGSLVRAETAVRQLADEAGRLRARSSLDAARLLELRAGLDCARTIVSAARLREESRGAHWRKDFPETSDRWRGHIRLSWLRGEAAPYLAFVPASG